MFELMERENEIIDMLMKLSEVGLDFVVVGGYGVSAYRHRFSVDADLIIRKDNLKTFENVLRENGYRRTISRIMENIYSSEFVRYEKSQPKVSIDLLIGGLGVRQTEAAFSYDFIFSNSEKREIEGSEKIMEAIVPRREVLIIMKLHSGRLTDFRDVAALCFGLDFGFIKKHLFRGNIKTLKENIEKFGILLEKPEFQDSFKGVFMEKSYRIDIEEIRKLIRFLTQ